MAMGFFFADSDSEGRARRFLKTLWSLLVAGEPVMERNLCGVSAGDDQSSFH